MAVHSSSDIDHVETYPSDDKWSEKWNESENKNEHEKTKQNNNRINKTIKERKWNEEETNK